MGTTDRSYDARSLVDKGYVDSVKATMTSGAGGVGTLNYLSKFSSGGMVNSSIKDTSWVSISANNGLLATGTYGSNGVPAIAGAGTRMMWMPSKAAFRAGNVSSTYWDSASIGAYSVALGQDVRASGTYSLALGSNNTSTGTGTTAFGYGNNASNSYSTVFGYSNTANNAYSTAFGQSTTASGNTATAFGYGTTASGSYATAFGYSSVASGNYCLRAIGYGNAIAQLELSSTAIGNNL